MKKIYSSFKNKNNIKIKQKQVQDVQKHKSALDQFCDFTSLVGFRLLHSKHFLWLRILSAILMIISTALILLQTSYFWKKYVESKGQRIATVKETENQELLQPSFLVCFSHQTISLMRGYGSVDFREIVYRHQIEAITQTSVIEQLKKEMALLDSFINSQIDSNETLKLTGIKISRKLKLIREVKAALAFDDAEKFVNPLKFNSTLNFKVERAQYRRQRNRLDSCLIEYIKDPHMDVFVNCRFKLARKIYFQFNTQQKDYFSYARSVWLDPDQLIVKSHFFNDGSGHWERSWQVDNGLCALGKPQHRKTIDLKLLSIEQNFDYILVKSNRLEGHPNARIYFYLLYENPNTKQLIRANSYELISGKNLELTVRGMSEIMQEDCTNSYPSDCTPSNDFVYSPLVCKWCQPQVRAACPCANPDLYFAEYKHSKDMRNCTLLDVLECGARQKDLFTRVDCPNACSTTEYTGDYAAFDLTLEMLNISIEEAEQSFTREQMLLLDKLNEFKWPKIKIKRGKDTKIWRASKRLDLILDDYYNFVLKLFRFIYGSSFSFPTIFAEDVSASLNDSISGIYPLFDLTELKIDQLDLCGANNESGFAIELGKFGKIFLEGIFRKMSWNRFYPCPVSISSENCQKLLNNGTWDINTVKKLQKLERTTFYRQCTLELALTLNSTPANPICIVQFYSHAIENFVYFNKTLARLRSVGNELLGNLKNKYELPDKECQQRKIEQLKELLKTKVLKSPTNTSNWNNEWIETLRKFLQEHSAMRMINDFLTARMALITVYYRGLTYQRIIYRDGYTLWELMSDVGGVLGLYFGLTIITVYEIAVFLTLVDREPAEVHRPPPARAFTRRLLYNNENFLKNERLVPTIF